MPAPQAKPGDIIKLTRLREFGGGPGLGYATTEHPAWFRVIDHNNRDGMQAELLIAHGPNMSICKIGFVWAISTNAKQREQWGDSDYEIVDEVDVPGYVWAVIAKQALLGGGC